MIRMEDLMVGNFAFGILKGEKKCFSVTDIITHEPSPTRMVFSEDEDLGPFGVLASEGAIDGIPVTVDMLKRIGFEEYEDLPLEGKFYRYWDKDYKYKLEVCDDEEWCNSDRKFTLLVDNSRCMGIGSAEFTYVHELQNLTRCISGHSLPITKEMIEDV